MTENVQEYRIFAQEDTTVQLLEGFHVDIQQEDEASHTGVSTITIRGPVNLDQFIAILQKVREQMA